MPSTFAWSNRRPLSWEFWFGLLEQFVADNGMPSFRRPHTVDGYQLGQWVTIQRSFHNKGILRDDRGDRLEKLPGWTWDMLADQWEEGFTLLEQYVADNGDACVPQAPQGRRLQPRFVGWHPAHALHQEDP